jgi:hypothetical protein
MKKYVIAISMLIALPVAAQETYENANIVTEELNGTARYVGMGGAMDALGADLSTIASNPAGIGLFRSSQIAATAGLTTQQNAKDFHNASKTHANFDQIGFVWSSQESRNSFLNVAFNYHKSRDFNYILSASQDVLSQQASQNALSYIKAIGDVDADGWSTIAINKGKNSYSGDFYWTSQLDNLYYNAFIMGEGGAGFNMANAYNMNRASKGYIGEYDFALSGNIHDRVYLGLTVGLQDVHYKGYSEYTESLIGGGQPIGNITVCDERKITGTGYNFRVGAIFRPIEDSAFRFGISFASPTFYDLTTSNYTYLVNNSQEQSASYPNYRTSDSYDFRLYSPMKLGLSFGHTIGNYLAIGAVYEYADYGATNPRIKEGDYYDGYWGTYYSESSRDQVMKEHTEQTLKGVSTIKLGVEYKPTPEVAFRLGYNYVSPMYNSNGFKDAYLDSYGTNVASATDYTNWKATNRLTAGVGFTFDKLRLDLAYQYTMRKGDFYPYMHRGPENSNEPLSAKYYNEFDQMEVLKNECSAVSVKDNRHQLQCTLTYTW